MARPARRPGNLPAEATSFVGRRRELADLRTTLAEARLVSLVGPGGVGKTRLALRAAADLGRRFPDGAWSVELAEVRDPALVGNAVLAALDLRDQTATEPAALLLSYLRERRLLLVVDNCEHVLEPIAGLLAEVLRVAPGVRVIATSREPLTVPGEHVLRVPPLDLPPEGPAASLEQLLRNEAVLLFAARAAAGSGGFEVTAANRAAVADLCRRLDGLPLAIELAAVRTRVLTVRQILDRLTDRFGLLTGGGRAALPRHQTLRTTIDWSHDLLTGAEQALLRRLGVFAGRFTLDDVEGVCAFGDVPAADVLDVLSSLVDKSLVLKEDAGDVACYRLHETMREYAGLRARAAGEQDALELRCADHYRARSLAASPDARYRLVEWLEWVDLEIDNIRAVLQWCLARRDRRRGLDLATAVGWYWITRATTEGVRWLDELLALADGGARTDGLTHFLRGFLAVLQFDPVAAMPELDRAVAASRAAGRAGEQAMSLSLAAIAHGMAGDRESAGRLLDAARELAAGLDDFPATVSVLQARSLGGLFVGDLEAVRSAATAGAELSRQVGDLYSLEMMLLNLGLTALVGGDVEGSRPLCVEALRIARRIDDRIAQYCLLDALGWHAAGSGRPQLAARLLGAAETVQAGVGASVLPYLLPLVAEAAESTAARLGAPAYQAEFDAGRRMNRDDAIALALGEPAAADAGPASRNGAPSPLGRRETEVARLVADGLSNKQIGARLLISEHTVDSHVRNILNKLGFSSRAQIAAWTAATDK
jgi:predicted ATPase/DNA-binding CsgD family transcriptional regulator